MIEAGCRSGRERKCWTPFEPAGTIASFIGLIVPNGTPTAKLNDPFVPPTTFSPVLTVTVSPGANGELGTKLPPWPSESAWIVPGCAPVLEPTTCTEPISEAGIPRKVIWVWGSELVEPGSGYTLTAAGWADAPAAAARNMNAATTVAATALLIHAFVCLETTCNL